jgi:hypothetical protein
MECRLPIAVKQSDTVPVTVNVGAITKLQVQSGFLGNGMCFRAASRFPMKEQVFFELLDSKVWAF